MEQMEDRLDGFIPKYYSTLACRLELLDCRHLAAPPLVAPLHLFFFAFFLMSLLIASHVYIWCSLYTYIYTHT